MLDQLIKTQSPPLFVSTPQEARTRAALLRRQSRDLDRIAQTWELKGLWAEFDAWENDAAQTWESYPEEKRAAIIDLENALGL